MVNMKTLINTGLALVLCLSFLAVSPVWAGDVLTWEDCVRAAMANNPSLNAKRRSLEQSEYNYKDAFNTYLPSIGLSHGYSLGGPQFSGGGRGSWSAGISASETLWSMSNNSSYRSSKLTYEQAKIAYEIESASLRKTLYSKFMTLLVEQEQEKVNDKVLKIRRENANLTKLKYESGRESLGNMKYAQAQYNQARISNQKSARALENARRELLSAMGENEYRKITVKAALKTPDSSFTESELRYALENSPIMKNQRITLEKTRENVKSADSKFYPSISASQSLNWSGDREFPNDSKRWSVGISLSLPIFSGGLTHLYHTRKAAQAGLKAAEETYRSAKMELENSLRSAHAGLLNACETVAAGQQMLDASEERYKEAHINYMSGNMSFINFETVEQNLVDAQQNQLQYLKTANEQKINLENLLGVTLEK